MTDGAPKDRLERICHAVEASSGKGLDDVSRARIKQRLMRELESEEVRRIPPASRGPGWRWTAAVAAVALAVLSGVLLDRWREAHPPPANLHLLVVRSVADPVAGGRSLRRLLGRPASELAVPAGTSLRATVGTAGTITLLGGSRVSVVRSDAYGLEVRLHSGTVAAQVMWAHGRRFVVSAPGGTVSVVGTNFAVQVLPAGLGVAVEKGVVVVRPRNRGPVVVQAGQAWDTTASTPSTIPAALQRLLVAHRMGKPVAAAEQQIRSRRPISPAPPAPPPPSKSPVMERVPARVVSPRALYARAEAALRGGKHRQARQLLRRLVSHHPGSLLCDSARYDLARLALEQGKTARARARLEELLKRGRDRSLQDPARFMLCRIHVKAGASTEASSCLATFRKLHPLSPHDQEALHLLSRLRLKAGGCDGAVPLAREYLRRYPRGLFAVQATALLARCAK